MVRITGVYWAGANGRVSERHVLYFQMSAVFLGKLVKKNPLEVYELSQRGGRPDPARGQLTGWGREFRKQEVEARLSGRRLAGNLNPKSAHASARPEGINRAPDQKHSACSQADLRTQTGDTAHAQADLRTPDLRRQRMLRQISGAGRAERE